MAASRTLRYRHLLATFLPGTLVPCDLAQAPKTEESPTTTRPKRLRPPLPRPHPRPYPFKPPPQHPSQRRRPPSYHTSTPLPDTGSRITTHRTVTHYFNRDLSIRAPSTVTYGPSFTTTPALPPDTFCPPYERTPSDSSCPPPYEPPPPFAP